MCMKTKYRKCNKYGARACGSGCPHASTHECVKGPHHCDRHGFMVRCVHTSRPRWWKLPPFIRTMACCGSQHEITRITITEGGPIVYVAACSKCGRRVVDQTMAKVRAQGTHGG